jgi:hypothetical protein
MPRLKIGDATNGPKECLPNMIAEAGLSFRA